MKAGPAVSVAAPVPQPTAPAAPVQRQVPPEGYREALATHRAAWTRQQHTNPKIHTAAVVPAGQLEADAVAVELKRTA